MKYPLRPWSDVKRPWQVKNLPPYCYIGVEDDPTGCSGILIIKPDVYAALQAVIDSDLPCKEQVEYQRPTYRGLMLDVNDHGNVTLLYRFANGNTREIWGCV